MLSKALWGGLLVTVLTLGGLAVLGKIEGISDVIFAVVLGLIFGIFDYLRNRQPSRRQHEPTGSGK